MTELEKELLASLKEMREIMEALMRAIENAQVINEVMELMPTTWDGFGKRLQAIIAKAEGQTPEPPSP